MSQRLKYVAEFFT